MKSIKFTVKGQEKNDELEKMEEIEYDELTQEETLVCDLGMYIDEAYIENKFENLEEWCAENQECECETTVEEEAIVLNKINEALKLNLIEITNN